MESPLSLLSYATDFSSIGTVVCEIYSNHWSLVCCVAEIILSTSKIHSSLIWTPFGLNFISQWRIGSLFSYATGFTSIRCLVWEISSNYQTSPKLIVKQSRTELLITAVNSSFKWKLEFSLSRDAEDIANSSQLMINSSFEFQTRVLTSKLEFSHARTPNWSIPTSIWSWRLLGSIYELE